MFNEIFKMKKIIAFSFLFIAICINAQLVTLSKAVNKSDNVDKFFYLIDPEKQPAEYLGEVEVDGYSENDADVFSMIYKKAKTVGANAFSLYRAEMIDGKKQEFNPRKYRLNLYYSTTFPKEDNVAYLFSSGKKGHKIKLDGKKITLQPRSFIKKVISYGGENSIVAGNLLGSRINLSAKSGQPVQYFQISNFDAKSDEQGSISIKSGDIIGLERSYANFLSIIYEEQKVKD